MEEEGQVHCILLSIVISDEIDGLEVISKGLSHRQHVPDKFQTMLLETFDDLHLLASVRHKVIVDDSTVNEGLNVELLFENKHHQGVLFGRSEPLVLGSASVAERQGLVFVLKLDLQSTLFSFLIQHAVLEEDEHDDLRIWELRVLEDLVTSLFLFQAQASELLNKDLDSLGGGDEEIVGLAGLL